MRSRREVRTRLVALRPVPGETLRHMGLPVAAEAPEYKMAGLSQTLLQLAQG